MNLFAYGTLMFPEIWDRVVGREFRWQEAAVRGMAVYQAAGEVFPVMVTGSDEAVAAGVVYFDLTAEVIAVLDEYESDFYDRIAVTATLNDGGDVAAQAYVLPSRHHAVATQEPWSASWFRDQAIARYIEKFGL